MVEIRVTITQNTGVEESRAPDQIRVMHVDEESAIEWLVASLLRRNPSAVRAVCREMRQRGEGRAS